MKMSVAERTGPAEIEKQIDGVRVGKIVEVDESGHVWVNYRGSPFVPIRARLTGKMNAKDINRVASLKQSVLLVFEENDPSLPIIVDTVQSSPDETAEPAPVVFNSNKPRDIEVDGERVTFNAKQEIVLRCGSASITLTRAGKILIRGAYLLNRSSGVNRIKGGSVQIN